MQKAVFPIQSHADITKAINYMHTNYTQAINEGKPLRVVIDQKQDDRSTAQNRLVLDVAWPDREKDWSG
jgi:hypothetical protein